MPLQVTHAVLWQRLFARFKLLANKAGVGTLGDTIVPVTDVGILLQEAKGSLFQAVRGAGNNGPFAVYTVPDGKRAKVYSVYILRAGGDNQVKELESYDASEAQETLIDTSANQTAYAIRFSAPWPLEEKDSLRVTDEGDGVASTTWNCYVWAVDEDAY